MSKLTGKYNLLIQEMVNSIDFSKLTSLSELDELDDHPVIIGLMNNDLEDRLVSFIKNK